jgi:hypothetical protein
LLPERLTSIDATNREQHSFLEPGDRCLYFGEYFAYRGYQGGGTNQLILNFKCRPTLAAAHPGRRNYKEQAIEAVAAGLRGAIPKADAERMTWVPVPPSKVVGHPDHDDRLTRTLARAFSGYDADVRCLLRQTSNCEADHTSGSRMTSDALHALIEWDRAALDARPLRQTVVLFDDVLTTGKHFKCGERRLRECVPVHIPIVGVFIARRILPDGAAGLAPVPTP